MPIISLYQYYHDVKGNAVARMGQILLMIPLEIHCLTIATFTWEMGRQLSSVTFNGKTTSYKYDDDGFRTEKTALGSNIKYVYMDGVLSIQGDIISILDSSGIEVVSYEYKKLKNN